MTTVAREPDGDLALLISSGETTRRALLMIAAAESLTDDLAQWLLRQGGMGESAVGLVGLLHDTDLIYERNSEWNFRSGVRAALVRELSDTPDVFGLSHQLLLRVAQSRADISEETELPRYLKQESGRAYHTAAVHAGAGLDEYVQAARRPRSSDQWLASVLATEQQKVGVLPAVSAELDFLRGMVLMREGRYRNAEPLLRGVAELPGARIETAISAHVVGRRDGRVGRIRDAIRLLNKSIEILEVRGDQQGLAMVLHSLGQLLGRDRKRTAEAEQLLRRSLDIEVTTGGRAGEAQVLHTLGQLLGRDRKRTAEAEQLLRRSLDIGEATGNYGHQAQVLRTLALLLAGSDLSQALELLSRSLDLNQQMNYRDAIRLVEADMRRLTS
jgi:tetratricopeptide (TPR) repeat protein